MGDDFYSLKKPSVKTVKEIFLWARDNAEKVNVDMRVQGELARKPADRSFEEVLGLVSVKALPYFRIIYRKQMNLFGILYNDLHISDILEIAIRGIDVKNKEYFLFIYLNKKHIQILKKQALFKGLLKI
jgi:hypothetical protein